MARALSFGLVAACCPVSLAIPESRQRFCANGIDFRTQNGDVDRVSMQYRLCMDRSIWAWRQELDCKESKPGAIPLARCNITGMHETTIQNQTHTGRIQPIAPGKVTCQLSEIPEDKQCKGVWQEVSDCNPACGEGASCCRDPASPLGPSVQGACYKVANCSQIMSPACSAEPFAFIVTDSASTMVGKETLEGIDVEHWAATRMDKKNNTNIMHYYFQSEASLDGSKPLLRTAYETHFDVMPGDGGDNITQLGIRDWSANYTDDIPESTFVLAEVVVPEEADDQCRQVIAMDSAFWAGVQV